MPSQFNKLLKHLFIGICRILNKDVFPLMYNYTIVQLMFYRGMSQYYNVIFYNALSCTPSFWEDKLHPMDNILFYTVTDRNIASSFPPVVCRRAHILFTLFVFACVWWCPTHIIQCFSFVCLRLVSCQLCYWFLWIVHFDCPFDVL